MKLLPTEAGARRRLILMIAAVAVLGFLYWNYGGGPQYVIPQTLGPAPTSKPAVSGRQSTRQQKGPVAPQKLRLEEMDYVPDEPEAGRDLFRFGVKPTPKPVYTPPPPPPVYTPPPPPPPPPPPKVPLLLTTIFVGEDGKRRAYLHDKAGTTFEGVEGDTIDGRYKLLRVGETQVVMIFVDGTGQTVINKGG